MAFEVAPRRIRRARWPALVAVAGGAAILAIGLSGLNGERRPADEAEADAGPTVAARTPGPTRAGRTPVVPAPVPLAVDCGEVPQVDCRLAVLAARRVAAANALVIDTATVHPTLLCGDDFDCPPSLLRGTRALGSVVLTFVDDPFVAWLNVAQPRPDGVREGSPRQPVAIVVRWLEDAGS